MKKVLLFLSLALCSAASQAQPDKPGRLNADPALAPFYHGIASGDPLPDRVILWTRITSQNLSEEVTWEIATDTAFEQMVNNGSATADTSRDMTVKVDVGGLQPNTWYYYRFKSGDKYSLTGRTRTAALNGISSLRFAVVSCSNLPVGYFNVYHHITSRNDVDAVLHLGDYIYEYKSESAVAGDSSRLHSPDKELLTLADYRMRYSQYRLDADLRDCHQQFPFICVWDDHETANNSWKDGAENHNLPIDGIWTDRKQGATRAYLEWMPIREKELSGGTGIYRNIHFGLADIVMIDTRLEGRDQQIPGTGILQTDPLLMDTLRSMLGQVQLSWLKDELKQSAAQWKIIGNQVMVAPLTAGPLILNSDQWDGYPAERKRIFDHILKEQISNIVFITGDIHTSWGNDLPYNRSGYNASTGEGSVGVEFVCTSITSGMEVNILPQIIQLQNPHMKYIDLQRRGYVLMDINTERTQGDWIHMSTIASRSYTASASASWEVRSGERFLRKSSSSLALRTDRPILAPRLKTITGTATQGNSIVGMLCYPNPFNIAFKMQYYQHDHEAITASLYDLKGNVVHRSLASAEKGLHEIEITLPDLPEGVYIFELRSKSGSYRTSVHKGFR